MQLRNRLAQDVRDGARLEEIRVMSISSTQDIRLIPAYGASRRAEFTGWSGCPFPRKSPVLEFDWN